MSPNANRTREPVIMAQEAKAVGLPENRPVHDHRAEDQGQVPERVEEGLPGQSLAGAASRGAADQSRKMPLSTTRAGEVDLAEPEDDRHQRDRAPGSPCRAATCLRVSASPTTFGSIGTAARPYSPCFSSASAQKCGGVQ